MSKFTKGLIISSVIIVHILLILLIYNKHNNVQDISNDIILKTNAGIPYSWSCNIQDVNIVDIENQYTKDLAAKNVTGGPLEIHYVLKAKNQGNTTVICEYRNFADNVFAERKIYNVEVDEDLDIKIEEK